MPSKDLQATVQGLVRRLARGDYEGLVAACEKSRLSAADLERAVTEYGAKLAVPPKAMYRELDAVQVRSASVPTWSVRVPLWTEEEGRSDLTLELTISLGPSGPSVELDDLRVL